jgi:hypothetical protein
MKQGKNLVIIEGEVATEPRFHTEGRWPRVSFTLGTPQGKFYVEGTGVPRLRDACFAPAGSSVMVVGHLFRRKSLVGIDAEQIVPLNGQDREQAAQCWERIRSILE